MGACRRVFYERGSDVILKGSDIVVRTLIEQGVDVVFGYPGGNVIDIYDSLYKYSKEIEHVLVTHEQQAAHAADGYARATGRTGVCIATSGPGATNLVTGIATAYLDSIPLVAITGNVPWAQIGTDSFQEIDITGITLPITKHNYFVGDVDDLEETIRDAFELAVSGRPGPVLVDIAKNAQQAKGEYSSLPPVRKAYSYGYVGPELERAAATINASERPLVYFGGGAIASGAEGEVSELAEKIDAPISCSLMGISALPTDTPRLLGMEGMHGHFASSRAMAKSDCVIALGVRFNDRATGDRAKFVRGTKIVHIDIDESEFGKTVRDEHDLGGDVRLTLQKLIPLLERKERPEWSARVERFRDKEDKYADHRDGMTPKNIMLALNEHRDPDMRVVTDVGQHQMWAAQYLSFSKRRTFVTSGGLGTMGFGMGASIGAAMGTGERTFLIVGDGGFSMSLNEFATAVKHDLPITVILLKNGVLGMVRQQQRFICKQRYSNTDLELRTDFVALAKAFGGQAERVGSLEEFEAALERAGEYGRPYLIEVPVDKDELVMPMMLPGGTPEDLIVSKDGE